MGADPLSLPVLERGAWPLQAGSSQDRVPGSDSFRADFPSQTLDLQDRDLPPGSQIKTSLHGVGLPALVKDQAGCSVLAPAARTDPPLPGREACPACPADSTTAGRVQRSEEASGLGRHPPLGVCQVLDDPLVMRPPQAVNSSNGERLISVVVPWG